MASLNYLKFFLNEVQMGSEFDNAQGRFTRIHAHKCYEPQYRAPVSWWMSNIRIRIVLIRPERLFERILSSKASRGKIGHPSTRCASCHPQEEQCSPTRKKNREINSRVRGCFLLFVVCRFLWIGRWYPKGPTITQIEAENEYFCTGTGWKITKYHYLTLI